MRADGIGRGRPSGAARTILLSIVLTSLLAACGGLVRPSARYAGEAPACGRVEGGGVTATLTRLGDGFAFAPYDGSLVVNGKVAPDGTLSGTLPLRPAEQKPANGAAGPAPHAAQMLSVTGHLTPEAATVSYTAPGCTAELTLARVHPPLL